MAYAQTRRCSLLLFAAAMALRMAAAAQPLQPGEAVATCFSDNKPNGTGPVAGIFDIRDPVGNNAPLGASNQPWAAPHGKHWTRAELGNNEVFGITLDDAPKPNVYLTSTAIYKTKFSSLDVIQNVPGTGQVWRIDGTTLAPSLCVTLPQSTPTGGQGLGNIAYDAQHRQLFVTDFHDGKVHRIGTNCQYLDAYDPFQPFGSYANTAGGFAPLGERLWGVGVFQARLYFARWSRDQLGGSPNEVWSIPLDPTGKPVGAPKLEITPPGTMPVADIEFSLDGRMLLAQRSMNSTAGEAYSTAHQSELLEYHGASGSWAPSANIFQLGDPTTPSAAKSSAGGADYVCPTDGFVVGTGDALMYSPTPPQNGGLPRVYGLQIMPSTGGNKNNSYLVDLDGFTGAHDKVQIGDVDVYNTCDRQCGEFLVERVLCETDRNGKPTGKFTVQFRIKNHFKEPVFHTFLVGLPGGATASPSYFPVAAGNDGDLDPGEVSQLLTTTISGATAGQALSFQITLHNQDLVECCATRVTITLPKCDCAQVTADSSPTCHFFRSGVFNYSFTLQSLFAQANPAFVLIVPDTPKTATFIRNVIPFTVNPQKISLTIGNVSSGQRVCFLVSLHREDFERCCAIRHCVTLPNWLDISDDPSPIGDTEILFNLDGLSLVDPGLDPGARLPLAEGTTAFDLAWLPADAAALRVGGTLQQSVEGVVGNGEAETVALLVTTRTAAGAELRASFPGLGATRHRFEFYRNGERVGVQSGVAGDTPALCNCGPKITTDAHFSVLRWPGVPASQENPAPCEGTGPGCVFAGFTFPEAQTFQLAGSDLRFEADEVQVIPENGSGVVRSLTTTEVRASGLAKLTLTDFRADRDCNGNGIPDYDEITSGGALDLNLDGIPDTCEAPVEPSISLATGFDQAAGATLAPRANDDDWRLVKLGAERPARVIAKPSQAWPAPLSGSLWIGAEPERGASVAGVFSYLYERCFCLAADAREVTLDLQLQADDRARVFLNDQPVSDVGGGFRVGPLAVRRTGAAGDGLFRAGENCVAVEVQDSGGVVTGLTLAGSVTAPGGACRP